MEKRSQSKSRGSVLIKMATDGILNLYIAGSSLPKILLESQAVKENPNI
jgi:hypothetical protein